MASTLQISLAVVVVLFAVINIGTGLNCITCENDCATNTSKTCPAAEDQCIKLENGKGDKLIKRSCGTKDTCEPYKNCYTCSDKNDCNSSSSAVPSFLLMAIVGTLIAKRYM